MMSGFVKLSEDRVSEFDNHSTAEHTTGPIKSIVNQSIPRGDLLLVDVGGGNGSFLDQLLKEFPDAQGINVELSAEMCGKNRENSRKTVVCDNFISWAKQQPIDKKVDVVVFNFVLHHFVSADYAESLKLQQAALNAASNILADDGMIIIYEINYNGVWIDDLPSRLIHAFTASRWMAPFVKALGANTAGYGVCFHSENYWKSLCQHIGLSVADQYMIQPGVFRGMKPILHKLALHIGSMNYQIFFLNKAHS